MTQPDLFEAPARALPRTGAELLAQSVCTCRRCGQTIEGPAALDERQFFVHPEPCEPR